MRSQDFKQEVWYWSGQVGVKIKEVHLRRMTRKWGSCSTRGRLTFDPSLLEEAKKTRLRAVLHELLHLKYPNHGRMFTSLLSIHLRKALGQAENAEE